MIDVIKNYKEIEQRVSAACERAGRNRDEVVLIAVSKTKPDMMVEALHNYGVRSFGENKPQEIKRRHDSMPADINWHMIGNLQTNKVKMVVGRAAMIHSVNSLHLAEAISKESVKQGVTTKILLEVNVADEDTKQGASSAEALKLAEDVAALPGLEICGLMQIAPPVEDAEENRKYFTLLRLLRDEIRESLATKGIKNAPMTELSMGMTLDFEVAIEEGATFVRVGTAIFGERDYGLAP